MTDFVLPCSTLPIAARPCPRRRRDPGRWPPPSSAPVAATSPASVTPKPLESLSITLLSRRNSVTVPAG